MNTPAYCLVIAHDFPPFAGGGVMRIHKFVKYLPEFGITPIVVTIKENYYDSKDLSLFNEYSQTPEIYRTRTINIKSVYNFFKRKKNLNSNNINEIYGVDKSSLFSKFLDNASSCVLIPDIKILWLPFCLKECSRLIKKYSINTFISTSPPHSTQIAGLLLKKKFRHIRWIADFRDLWTDYDVYTYPFAYFKKIENYMEKKVFSNADKILCATEPVKKSFTDKYIDLNPEKFITLTNGFDPADFEEVNTTADAATLNAKSSIFRIVYTGSLNDWRNLDNFTQALRILLDKNLIDKNKIKIKLFGHITHKDSLTITSRKLSDIFEIHGMQEHRQSLAMLKEADMLLLIIGQLEGAEVMTGKIYEYIGARRNIFGIVINNGEAERILKKYSLGYTADTSSPEIIAEIFLKAYNDFFSGLFKHSPDSEVYKVYSRYELARKLAVLIKAE